MIGSNRVMNVAGSQCARNGRLGAGVVLILAVAGVLGATANTLSPRRIAWREDWANHVEAKATEAGISVMNVAEAQRAVNTGQYIILDARPVETFGEGHLPGAISLPWTNLDEQFGSIQVLIKSTSLIIVYCSGKACDESLMVARFLREQGYAHIELFAGGFEAWQSAGLPVEQGD